jgi:hypothetical protein
MNDDILKSQLRAAWIEWLYIDDEDSRTKQEKLIIQIQYKMFHKCSDTTEVFQMIQDEIKRLPIPSWASKILD